LSQDLTDNVEYINHGGCGVVAAEVVRILADAGVPSDVIVTTYDRDDPSPAEVRTRLVAKGFKRDVMHNWDMEGLHRGHLAVRFKLGHRVFHWDSEGVLSAAKGFTRGAFYRTVTYPLGEGLLPEEVQAMADTEQGWNSSFDRGDIPMIQELVHMHLGDLA
jgi:hypothetical protein